MSPRTRHEDPLPDDACDECGGPVDNGQGVCRRCKKALRGKARGKAKRSKERKTV